MLAPCIPSLPVLEPTYTTGLPIPLVKIISKQLLEGVKYLHESRQLIHTDLKVENILLTCISPKIQQMKTDFVQNLEWWKTKSSFENYKNKVY